MGIKEQIKRLEARMEKLEAVLEAAKGVTGVTMHPGRGVGGSASIIGWKPLQDAIDAVQD